METMTTQDHEDAIQAHVKPNLHFTFFSIVLIFWLLRTLQERFAQNTVMQTKRHEMTWVWQSNTNRTEEEGDQFRELTC